MKLPKFVEASTVKLKCWCLAIKRPICRLVILGRMGPCIGQYGIHEVDPTKIPSLDPGGVGDDKKRAREFHPTFEHMPRFTMS